MSFTDSSPAPRSLLIRTLRCSFAVAFIAASAFCAAQSPPTSGRVPIAPRVPNPSLAVPPATSTAPAPAVSVPAPTIVPAPTPVPGTTPDPTPDTTPAPDTPSTAVPSSAPPTEPVSPVDGADLVLVLPLQSQDYARAAEAVRDGFLAAAEAMRAVKRVRVIGHGDGGVIDAFDAAKSLGARVVVGPLVRDDLRALAASDLALPLTLALNQLDDGVTLPPQIYTLALAVESDARVLARRMRADNIQKAVVIGGGAPLMRRFAMAFAGEWLLAGGGAPQAFGFDASPDGLGILRRELVKANADGALIALDGSAAALARSFVPRLPAYASSLVNQPLDPAVMRDLEGVTFVDVPWIVTPNHPSLARLPRKPRDNLVLERLYALGLDAFEIARGFASGVPQELQIAGATGRLTLAEGRQFQREGTLAVFRQGLIVPADGR